MDMDLGELNKGDDAVVDRRLVLEKLFGKEDDRKNNNA